MAVVWHSTCFHPFQGLANHTTSFNFGKEIKKMKNINVLLALICFVLMATIAPLTALAAEGSAGSGGADANNNINVYDLIPNGAVSVEEVTMEGTVAHYAGFNADMVSLSQWMVMDPVTVTVIDPDVAEEDRVPEALTEVTVYGLGPICYWDAMGFVRPQPEITLDLKLKALRVTYGNEEVRYVVLTVVKPAYIIVDGLVVLNEYGVDLEVRSVAADTYGLPLWLVKNQSKQDSNQEDGGGRYNQP